MSTINEWMQSFLKQRNLDDPDGRPLYALRCKPEEFHAVQDLVSQSLHSSRYSGAPIKPITSQAFCLWAAEWWRRNHAGGHWRWDELLGELGHSWLAPGSSGYQQLCGAVASGLARWRRPLLRTGHGRAFLVTLACEGGLPLRLLLREQASLRRYFRALLEEIRIFGAENSAPEELAERCSAFLPKSLRQDVVYSLSGQLVTRIWQLQAAVQDSTDPLKDLDQRVPRWRDDLPLRVSDAIATALLRNLLEDASDIARRRSGRFRWARSLVQAAPGEWVLQGTLEVPRSMAPGDYSQLFEKAAGEVPRRFDLSLRSEFDGGDHTIALCTLLPAAGGEESLRVEASSTASQVIRGEAAADAWSLISRSRMEQSGSNSFPGAAALSELPWVFEGVGTETEPAALIGEGSIAVKGRAVLVAVPADAILLPDERADVHVLGSIPDFRREVVQVAGSVTYQIPGGGHVKIKTGDPTGDGPSEYVLRGNRLKSCVQDANIFVGVPNLLEYRDNQFSRRVDDWKLEWRADGESGWRRLTGSSKGTGRVRYVDNGSTRFSARVVLLPETAAIRYTPGLDANRGTIELIGFRSPDIDAVALIDAPEISSERRHAVGDVLRLTLSCAASPPRRVTLRLGWKSGERCELELLFPGAGSGFERPDHSPIALNAVVAVSKLPGLRAAAMVPDMGRKFWLEMRYRGKDADTLGATRRSIHLSIPEITPGRFELDLGIVQSRVIAWLDSSTDPDGYVRLEIHGDALNFSTVRVLDVARHDIELRISDDSSVLYLTPESVARLDPEEFSSIRIEAIPLDTPDQPVTLERKSLVGWRLPEYKEAKKAWVIAAWQGDWCRARPKGFPAETRVTLDLQALGANADHTHWSQLEDLIEWVAHVPPVNFNTLARLIRHPQTMALAALRLTDARFDLFWPAMETLPFSWNLLPHAAWVRAIDVFVASTRESFRALDVELRKALDVERILREQLDRGYKRVIAKIPALEPVLAKSCARVLGLPLSAAANAVLRPEILALQLRTRWRSLDYHNVVAGNLSGTQPIEKLPELVTHLPRNREIGQLWYKQPDLEIGHPRFSVGNAPVIAALAALGNVTLTPVQISQLRGIREINPDWFDESYDASYLYAYGTLERSRHAHVQSTPEAVLPFAN